MAPRLTHVPLLLVSSTACFYDCLSRGRPKQCPPSLPPPPPTYSKTPAGDDIIIEERPAAELKTVAGVKIAPDGIDAWNPAFDVTPAALITAIVTDKGLIPRQTAKANSGGDGEVEGEKALFDVEAFCRECDAPGPAVSECVWARVWV